jgi:hypothetical protein
VYAPSELSDQIAKLHTLNAWRKEIRDVVDSWHFEKFVVTVSPVPVQLWRG